MAIAATAKVSFMAPDQIVARMQVIADEKHLKFSDIARAAFREYVANHDEEEAAA